MQKTNIKDKLPGVKENVPMSLYTSFKIGGPARYFFTAKSEKDIRAAIEAARQSRLPFFVTGQGSNLLVSDRGYPGLVIKISNRKLELKGNKISAEAGIPLKSVVDFYVKKSLAGMEWAEGIPGTVGAAVYGNAGAFGSTMADSITGVKVLDIKDFKIRNFPVKECGFGNKGSIFKKDKNLVILSVSLKSKKGDKEEIRREAKRFSDYRKNNHPLDLPSAGCFFKNYSKKITDKDLLKKYPELIEFNKGSRIPTSYLIDKAGAKGRIAGRAQVSEKHANFIVNLGGAKAGDVLELAKFIKEKVYAKFRINLEEEVQKLGF
jgi:UDP-N-acetylmuramate dehydrogenase